MHLGMPNYETKLAFIIGKNAKLNCKKQKQLNACINILVNCILLKFIFGYKQLVSTILYCNREIIYLLIKVRNSYVPDD